MLYLRTNEIVVPQAPYEGQQLRSLVREGVVPQMVIARDEAGAKRPDIRSYTAALKRQMARVREAAGSILAHEVSLDEMIRVETVAAADLRHVVKDANDDPRVDSVIVMSPTEENYDELAGLLSPDKDVDGMNPASQRTPCTPQAIQDTLGFYDLWHPDLNYLLVGKGRTVNSHVDKVLQHLHGDKYEDRVHIITRRNEDDLVPAMAVSDVAIVAAGVRHQIRPGMIHADMKAVVGVCIEDLHPAVYNLPGKVLVTPVHRDPVNMGIGANTASIAVQQTLAAATLRLPVS